ncbi:MAG: NapC/NirT family cytochrome c [Chloroflexi bacterium]|nr:NapC/NirT family cytochrome c [Chloroflexota bacterium]
MTRFVTWLRRFLFPPTGSPRWLRASPYVVLGLVTLGLLVSGAYAWDYTNSPPFCGTSCHTMPPEYAAYQVSPHARIACVECHIGREFVGNQIVRKAGDIKHIVSLAFKQYEFPITANDMRPATETCEKCHSPEKFASDSLRLIQHFGDDVDNTPTSTYLILKTGGGSKREGLGRGIHWHIANRVLYYPTDKHEQTIPYVRVYNDDGSVSEYTDINSTIDTGSLPQDQLKEMDCITCHNRITHRIYSPEDSMDSAMERNVIDVNVPEIHKKGVEVLRADYATSQAAMDGIAALDEFYKTTYPDYYAQYADSVQAAITAIQQIYAQSVFPEQKADWNSHSNNVGHKDSPGCFRCHDGKHLDSKQQAIPLECNLCHSVPVVSGAQDFVTRIEISTGPEPESHHNPNWIALHRESFDQSCSLCHTTDNAGGTVNTSFCSNSACHGSTWTYAGLDAPQLAVLLAPQVPTPVPTPTPAPPVAGPPTYVSSILPLFTACSVCHSDAAAGGLNLMSYPALLKGGKNGPVITPGDSAASLLVKTQSDKHFANVSPAELALIGQWIDAGAPEK